MLVAIYVSTASSPFDLASSSGTLLPDILHKVMVVKMAIVVSQVKMLMILTAMLMVIKDDNII